MNDFFHNQLYVGDFVVSVGVSEAALKVGIIKNIDTVKRKISILNCSYVWDTTTRNMMWKVNSKPGAYTDSKRIMKVDRSSLPSQVSALFP